MQIEILVVAMILLVLASLVMEESDKRPQWHNKMLAWWKTKKANGRKRFQNLYPVRVYREGKAEVAKKDRNARVKQYRDAIQGLFHARGYKNVTVFGGELDWNPVTVYLNNCPLHEGRQIMRLVLGKWEDKAEPGGCDEEGWGEDRKHMLTVYYVPPNFKDMVFPTKLHIKYDLDNLPPGLLKEGCEVVREEKITVSCSVRCAA